MFDDPRKELARLQKELLAAEAEPEVDEEDSELELDDLKQLLGSEDWEEEPREPLFRSYTEDDGTEEFFSIEEAPEEPPRRMEKKKRGSNAGFLFAIVVEAVGIIALLCWWLLC